MGMATQVPPFTEIPIPNQKVFDGVPFPLGLAPSPSTHGGGEKNLAGLVIENKQWLEERLNEAGALLFRGFDIHDPSDFNDVLEAFGYKEPTFVASGAKRTHIIGRVYTANDGPPSKTFHFHNEMAYFENHPTRAYFYCLEAPKSGGETPIVLGHVVYRRMAEKYPQFVEQMERCGLVYNRFLVNGTDPTSMVGRGWQATFNTNDRNLAEKKAAELGWELHWKEDGGAEAMMGKVQGVKVVKGPDGTPRKLWFNSLGAAHATWSEGRNGERMECVKFADGTPLPTEIIEDSLLISKEECVAFPWEHGDLLFLDNLAVQHSRSPFVGSRRVLAAFTV